MQIRTETMRHMRWSPSTGAASNTVSSASTPHGQASEYMSATQQEIKGHGEATIPARNCGIEMSCTLTLAHGRSDVYISMCMAERAPEDRLH